MSLAGTLWAVWDAAKAVCLAQQHHLVGAGTTNFLDVYGGQVDSFSEGKASREDDEKMQCFEWGGDHPLDFLSKWSGSRDAMHQVHKTP